MLAGPTTAGVHSPVKMPSSAARSGATPSSCRITVALPVPEVAWAVTAAPVAGAAQSVWTATARATTSSCIWMKLFSGSWGTTRRAVEVQAQWNWVSGQPNRICS
jgi:hypothetical protein